MFVSVYQVPGWDPKGARRLEESELAEQVAPMVRAMAPGFMAALGTFMKSGQDRRNLEADRAFIESMMRNGITNFRYHGVAMDFETFADAHNEEIERQVTNTINAMLKADSVVDWSKANPDQMSPEFRRRWIWEASNVSDETLQDLWARLLDGELESPGSVSNDTMSIARDLSKERAEEFQILCSAALCYLDGRPMIVVGCGDPGSNSLQSYGLSYDVLMRLAHHRLIINDMNAYLNVPVSPSQPIYVTRQQDLTWIIHWSDEYRRNDANLRIDGILLTPAGNELFAVVEKIPDPSYTAAMSKYLKQRGWTAGRISCEP